MLTHEELGAAFRVLGITARPSTVYTFAAFLTLHRSGAMRGHFDVGDVSRYCQLSRTTVLHGLRELVRRGVLRKRSGCVGRWILSASAAV